MLDVTDGGYAWSARYPDSVSDGNEDENGDITSINIDEHQEYIKKDIGYFVVDQNKAPEPTDLYIDFFTIDKQHLGKGYFPKLFLYIEKEARDRQKNRIVCNLQDDSLTVKKYNFILDLMIKNGWKNDPLNPPLLVKEIDLASPMNESLDYFHAKDANKDEYVIDRELNEIVDKKLFNNIAGKYSRLKSIGISPIGEGNFGRAYDIVGQNKVLKITKDKSEATESMKVRNSDPKRIAKIYSVDRITLGTKGEYYAIIMEKLNTKGVTNDWKKLDDFFQNHKVGEGHYFLEEILDDYANFKKTKFSLYKDDLFELLNRKRSELGSAYQMIVGMFLMIDELQKYGITSEDYINANNLGYKNNGTLAFFDMGFTDAGDISNIDTIKLKEGGDSKFWSDDGMVYERKLTFMPNSMAVKVKDKCRIGGNPDGTSDACNQGDIENLEIEPINEEMLNTFELPPFKIKDYDLILNGNKVGKVFLNKRSLSDGMHYDLSEISVDNEYRGQKIFTRFMNALIKNANQNNVVISLTPEQMDENGLTTNQLIKIYKAFGFKPNKGKNKNFEISNSYIKYPDNKDNLNESFDFSTCEKYDIPDEVRNFLKTKESDEQLLKSGGLPDDMLDRWAFGFDESKDTIMPNQLKIRWINDLQNVKDEIKDSGLSDIEWSKRVDLSEPIEVDYWADYDKKYPFKEGFYLQDGHHRYYAAKTLNKPLNMELRIEMNPIAKLGSMDYDDFHRCIWHQVNNLNEKGSNKYGGSMYESEEKSKDDVKVTKGSLMAYFDIPVWDNILNKIKDEDLYDGA